MSKVICYELNEVPWRVVDMYVGSRPHSHLATVLANGAAQITTETTDSGELHPWSTWPTMHRGVNNDVHNIRYINQDLSGARDTPPLWELLARAGCSVGIAGCLQSYPPLRHEAMQFHIPDTFASGSETAPAKYRHFQSLNLKLTGENRAVAGRLGLADFTKGLALVKVGLTAPSATKLALHLCKEVVNPLNKTRRATMQAYVAFDVFMDALKRARPSYGAFFSNHVAGVMHRYWKYSFPDDFGYSVREGSSDEFHAQSIVAAMDIFDDQFGRLRRFAAEGDYDLVIASSMGQEAVERGEYVAELLLDSVENLASCIGFAGRVKMNLAMQPDVALEFENQPGVAEFVALLADLTDSDGKVVLRQRYTPQGRTLNLSLARSKAAARSGVLLFRGKEFNLADVGMRLIARDPGTGYHQPHGVVIWTGPRQPRVGHRQVFDSRQYAPTVLRALGVQPPAYMMASFGEPVGWPRATAAEVSAAEIG